MTWGSSYEGSSFAIDSVLDEGIHESHSPERVLFLCVILQQLLDATKPNHINDSTYTSLTREQARSWLTSEVGVTAEDKETVCFLAGIEPEALTSYAKKIIDTKEVTFIRKRINAILHDPTIKEEIKEYENSEDANRESSGWYALQRVQNPTR
tara:strand:+ start:53 stop:511 length:459 start_codon:yes stop_codon:yes gene_type:complete